ncbi:hypothetical protein TSUD_175930 [Trifolium subterraneum]|uniref:Reverse transcriptase zinc-binding domain-containing protein n=1 Tax=Trifolium subterraneum TaxID=3900 RepID=A0A2Z6LPJ5_TRISU|nr:hypothetical protein TSUD_175930 [Trifolium subterraneum]
MQLCEPWCNHCIDIVEDTMHILRDCPLAKGVWCNLLNDTARNLGKRQMYVGVVCGLLVAMFFGFGEIENLMGICV